MILTKETRYLWAEKTFELMNIGAGALLFGQFLSEKGFSVPLTIGGLVLIAFGYIASLVLLRRK